MNDRTRKSIQIVISAVVGILLNVGGKILADNVSVPFYLDSIGTIVAIYFGGIFAGIASAAVNLIYAIGSSDPLLYVFVSLGVAGAYFLAGYFGKLERLNRIVIISFPISIGAAVASTIISWFVYDGYTGNMWGDTVIDMLNFRGWPPILSSLAGGVALELLDKQVCAVVAYIIIKLLKNRVEALRIIKKASLLGFAIVIAIMPVLLGVNIVDADTDNISVAERSNDYSTNYTSVVYDNSNGMLASEANAIAETEDGVLWIGSYAGLTRYDGINFQFIKDSRLASVTALMVDSKGFLWVGTNDGGLASYASGEVFVYDKNIGLSSNSIRSLVEDKKNGYIYVGTTDKLCRLTRDRKIEVIDEDIDYTISLLCSDGIIYGIDYDGSLYALEGGKIKAFLAIDEELRCACEYDGEVYAAGVSGKVYKLKLSDDKLTAKETFETGLNEINYLGVDNQHRMWACANDGMGYIAENGVFYPQRVDGFDNQIKWMHQDYQDNIWMASGRSGIAKLCENPFTNLFNQYGVEPASTNAVAEYNDKIYCATDRGLVILGDELEEIEQKLVDELEGNRVRDLFAGTDNNIWIATYGENGLVRFNNKEGVIKHFTESDGLTTNYVRCVMELKDGSVACGTTDGINFIKNDKIVETLTAADGLKNTQILNFAMGYDGTLFAGTDGGGLYTINAMKIERNYNSQTGLSSDIIMRVAAYERGIFIVVTNGIYYMEKDSLKRIDTFPYFNNFDVLFVDYRAYITSSAGVFVVPLTDLKNNVVGVYDLYGVADGIQGSLVANSWNIIDKNNNIYLCTNNGVVRFPKNAQRGKNWYKFDIDKVLADGEEIPYVNDVFEIPTGATHVSIRPSVRSYDLGDVQVKFYIDGIDKDIERISFKELKPIELNNINSGQYVIHMKLYASDSRDVVQEKSFMMVKDKELWESTWFSVYLLLVAADFVVVLAITIIDVVNRRRREKEKNALRKANEKELTRQVEKAKRTLEENQKEAQRQLKSQLEQTISALAKTVDAKDAYTNGHSSRVAKYAMEIARRFGYGWETPEKQNILSQAGLLHDVGKIKIPDNIINKPDKLTDEEYEIIKSHSESGYEILSQIEALPELARAARYHHERFDGKGYPIGLKGENIPVMARIIAVADSYDAMTSNRSYRKLLPQAVARAEIEKGKGTQFDPIFADIMIKMIDDDKDYRMNEDADSEDGINYDETWSKEEETREELAEAIEEVVNEVINGDENGSEQD